MASFSFNNAKNEKEDQSTKLPADIADLDISTEVTDGRTVGQGFTEAVNPNSVASAFASSGCNILPGLIIQSPSFHVFS